MLTPDDTTQGRPAVLLVDDYADALLAWEIYLQAEGFDVLTAADGPAALALATSAVPDVIVMDLALPGLSGCDVARALVSQHSTQHIPLIAATGFSDPAQLEDARLAGFDAILVKPCDPVALLAKIRELLTASGGSPPRS